VQLPQRKRVKVEQEPEEVSTVVSGKVVVSAMGSSRIVGGNQHASETKTHDKLLAKAEINSATRKRSARQKKTSSATADLSKIDAAEQDKASKQRKQTVVDERTKSLKHSMSHDKTSEQRKQKKSQKSMKRSASQQPPKKKKRSV